MKPSYEDLYHLYVEQGMTLQLLANHFQSDPRTVRKWLVSYSVPIRTTADILRGRSYKPQPDREELIDLYIIQKLPTRQIGERFGVSKTEVRRWMIEYGIDARSIGRGLLHYEKPEPTYEELYSLIHEQHCSYRDIATIYGISWPAVPHWLKKYHIPLPDGLDTRYKGNRPQLPDKEELTTLYARGIPLAAIGEMFGVGESTIGRLCRGYDIKVKPDGWNQGKRFLCQDGHLVRSAYEQRVDNWLFVRNITHIYEPPLPCDRRYKADFLANGWYIEIWGVTNNHSYSERRKHKCQLYQQHGYPLIELTPDFFCKRHQHRFEKRLTKVLGQPGAPFPSHR